MPKRSRTPTTTVLTNSRRPKNAIPTTLDCLGSDLLSVICTLLPLQFAFKLTCHALCAACPDKTTTAIHTVVHSVTLLAWAYPIMQLTGTTDDQLLSGDWNGTPIVYRKFMFPAIIEYYRKRCRESSVPVLLEYMGHQAAKCGHVVVLEWLREHAGYAFSRLTCAGAAMGGQLLTLKWLHSQGCPWDHLTCNNAAKGGHMRLLQWAVINNAPTNSNTCVAAAEGGQLDILKWMAKPMLALNNIYVLIPAIPNKSTADMAAQKGNVEMLQWLWEEGCEVDSHSLRYAVENDNIECLEWAANVDGSLLVDSFGVCWALEDAARCGNLRIVQWLHTRGYAGRTRECLVAARGGHLVMLQWLRANGYEWADLGRGEEVCSEAAAGGHLELLQWAYGAGAPCNAYACSRAAEGGHLETLKWLRLVAKCAWNQWSMVKAAQKGHIEVMAWLLANGAKCTAMACESAILARKYESVKWLRARGCPVCALSCSAAVRVNNMELLVWLRNNGCPWDALTCKCAAMRGNLGMLQYLHSQGCPWDETTCQAAARCGKTDCLAWAVRNGCDFDASSCVAAVHIHARCRKETLVAIKKLHLEYPESMRSIEGWVHL